MHVTAETLSEIAGRPINDNMVSTHLGLQKAGVGAGLERPHRLAMFLGQLSHESMGWVYDKEIWGPTAAQKRYEGRKDLGNTQRGDGSRFRGRGPNQLTGRDNYWRFSQWAKAMDPDAPNFTQNPDAVNSDPWEGLSAIWFWQEGNQTGKNLNAYADNGDFESVTRKINGGLNGYADRQDRYARAALVLLGRDPDDVKGFQVSEELAADGDVGPKTLAALHADLLKLPPVRFVDVPKVPVADAQPRLSIPKQPQGGGILSAIASAIAKLFGGK